LRKQYDLHNTSADRDRPTKTPWRLTVVTDWNQLLLAYLHDPPDKALSIRGHLTRARDNAQIAVGDHVSRKILEDAVSAVDPLASIIERLPMPAAGQTGERAVEPQDGRRRVFHPLSAAPTTLRVPELNDRVAGEAEQLRAAVSNLPGGEEDQARNRFPAVWRSWPEMLAGDCHSCLGRLPADTRTPDHAKDEVREVLDHLPKMHPWKIIQYHIYVRQKVQRGLDAAREGAGGS
jgi:CRISPR-associated protein Cmr2